MADDADNAEIIEDLIISTASAAAEVEADGFRRKSHDLTSLMALRSKLRANAVTNAWGSCARSHMVPPGSIGPRSTENQ